MISAPLLIHIQTHLRLGPLYNSQVSVEVWDGIYKFKESFRPDLRPQDGYPVVHLRECSGCVTCQHEDFSHQFFCRVIPAFVHLQVWVVSCMTWCPNDMLSFRCWLVLLAMNLSTVGTRAFSTSSVNSQAISLIFVIIHLYSFSPSTWTNSWKIWVSLLYQAVHWF